MYDEAKVVPSTNLMDRWIVSFTQSLLLFVKQVRRGWVGAAHEDFYEVGGLLVISRPTSPVYSKVEFLYIGCSLKNGTIFCALSVESASE